MKNIIFIIFILYITALITGCDTALLSSYKTESKRRDHITMQVKSEDPPIALVNGKKITINDIVPILMAGYGIQVLNKYTELVLVRTHAQKSGITLDETIADHEIDQLLSDMAPNQDLTQRYALLKYILKRRGMSLAELKMVLETTALLKQIVLLDWQPQHITPEAIRNQYTELYGEQMTIKIISVATQREIDTYNTLVNSGGDFYDIARTYSQDQISLANNAEIGPFTLYDEKLPQQIREVAFTLKNNNDISQPFQYYDNNHMPNWAIIKRISITVKKDIKITSVASEIKKIIHQKALNVKTTALLKSITENARITILDETLRINSASDIN